MAKKKKRKARISIEDIERSVEITEEQQGKVDLVKHLFDLAVNGKRVPDSQLYHQDYIKELIYHLGIKGKSYTSLAFSLGVSVNTLYTWEKKFPEWKRAKEIAEQGRLGYLEDLLIDLGSGKNKGNAAAAIFYAKNAAPESFKDKRELEHSGGVTYLIDTGIGCKPDPIQVENENKPKELSHPIDVEFEEVIEDSESDEDLL